VKIAIIGYLGIVGQAQARMFTGHDLVRRDTADGSARADLTGCDFAVVCVGTPSGDGGYADLTFLDEAISSLPESLPILIRSTVPPGTTVRVSAARSGITACAPEFLTERKGGAWPDSTDVPFLILGGDTGGLGFFRPRLAMVFPGEIIECAPTAAELVKYTANLYQATRVTFVNEMARICEARGVDWEQVRAAWLADSRVDPQYTAMEGFPPGFGGRCWPKDLEALITAARSCGYEASFLVAVREANQRFTAEVE
jgi:nucleotide sugar dehydrogenase